MRTIAEQLQVLLNEIIYEEENLDNMDRAWTEYDDPCSDPGLQYEQGQLIEGKYREFFRAARRVAIKFEPAKLSDYVIVFDDGSFNGKIGDGHPVAYIDEAKLYPTREKAEVDASTLIGVKEIGVAYDYTYIE